MKAIVHIGTEKTGTTSLQSALALSQNRLAAEGYFFTKSLGGQNNLTLAVLAQGAREGDALTTLALRAAGVPLRSLRAATLDSLTAELARGGYHTAIFSSEHLHSRLTDLRSKTRLRNLLRQFFSEITVIVYLRRQDRLALSRLSTELALGGRYPRDLLRVSRRPLAYYDYAKLLKEYGLVFGIESIVVRRYDRTKFPGGSIIGDFAEAINLPKGVLPELSDRNTSLCAAAQEYLNALNLIAPIGTRHPPDPGRVKLLNFLRTFRGSSLLPRREQAKRFVGPYVTGNDWVRQTFFPDAQTLFSNSFEEYPEEGLFAARESDVQLIAAKVREKGLWEPMFVPALRAD